MKDYYKILEVESGASEQTIKIAYKKLCLQLHPDKSHDLPESERQANEDRFKDVTTAYSTLSDPAKRQQYDLSLQGGGGGEGFGFANFFEMFRNAVAEKCSTSLYISLEDAVSGQSTAVNYTRQEFCDVCLGRGYVNDGDVDTCNVCSGGGYVEHRVQFAFISQHIRSPCSACQATGKRVNKPCTACKGATMTSKRRSATFNIPVGICDRQTVILKGKGHQIAHNQYDDLHVTVRIHPHKLFKRLANDDLECSIPIQLHEALAGFKASITMLDGSSLDVVSDSVVTPETRLEYAGRGMTRDNSLYVKFKIGFPKTLNEFTEKMQQIRSSRGTSPTI